MQVILNLFFLFGLIFPTIAGIALLIWAKRKKWFYLLIAAAFFPVLLTLARATMSFVSGEEYLSKQPSMDPETSEAMRTMNRNAFTIVVSVGAICTAIPLILGGIGLLFKKNHETVK